MMDWLLFLTGACTIAYGGYGDYKKREIPDAVPIVLILTSLPKGFLLGRLLIMILALLILLLAERLSKQELPGGDLKLICAMAFATGPFESIVILSLAGLGAVIVSLARKQPWKRHIPLCTYVAPAFILLEAAKLI
jgi:Flp pilus assembly protein protease CpaA